MSEFAELRSRSTELVDRMLSELEGKDSFGQYDGNLLEKLVKVTVILETQASKSGKGDPARDLSNEDLAAAYDEAD